MVKRSYLLTVLLSMSLIVQSQKSSDFLPDKPGNWTYSSNIKIAGEEVIAFNKNLSTLAEWFHQNVSMLRNPRGYDLKACSFGIWDDNYKLNNANYGLRAVLNFDFNCL
jgi:hypothetical protein